MAQMIKGQDSMVLIRECYKAVDADRYMYMTEWNLSIERDSDTESTFEGSYSKGGSLESTFSGTAKCAKGDSTPRKVFNAIQDDIRQEIWIFDGLVEGAEGTDDAGKFEAYYMQGNFSKFEQGAEVDDVMEYDTEFGIDGKVKLGFAELPEAVKEIVADYLFHEPTAADPALENEVIPQPTVE